MFHNFRYTIRNVQKRPINAVISVVGLSVAVACCLLIYLFARQELSVNQFHENSDRVYRINYKLKYGYGRILKTVRLDQDLTKELTDKVPQIESCTQYKFSYNPECKFNETYMDVEVAQCDKDFFNIFSFDFLIGSPTEVFNNLYEIVLTRSLADKLVDDGAYDQLIGQSIFFPYHVGEQPFVITGILEDVPRNSSMNFEAILPGNTKIQMGGCSNWFGNTSIFYLLKENADPQLVGKQVSQIVDDYNASQVQQMKNSKVLVNDPDAFTTFVTPFTENYFMNEINNCNESTGNKKGLMILISVGLIILIIACTNFIMFQLAQNYKKINEFGVRKTLGAGKKSVFAIFLSDGFTVSSLAFVIGYVLCFLLIPVFNNLSQTEIYTELIQFPKIILFSILALIAIVLITATVPLFSFSGVSPSLLLKKTTGNKYGPSRLQWFVSFQYGLSIILIIASIFIVRQTQFLKNKSLGLNSNNVLSIRLSNLNNQQGIRLAEVLKQHVSVENLTLSSRNFMNGSWNDFIENEDGEQILVDNIRVDDRYIPTMELQLLQGENFRKENINENNLNIIVNESFVKDFGIQDNPIGKSYRFVGRDFKIIGVVNDFSFDDMTQQIRPALLFANTMYSSYQNILVRYNPDQLPQLLEYIKTIEKDIVPGKQIGYQFWNQELAARYDNEERWSKIITYAAAIAIIISSLGLFGLTLLLINQRIKEIGVRKVNGAKTREVLLTIIKAFILWLVIAFLIAAPIAKIVVNKWLENYPFRIEVSWWVFLMAGILTIVVALLTVGFQSYQAARRNPVEALRYE